VSVAVLLTLVSVVFRSDFSTHLLSLPTPYFDQGVLKMDPAERLTGQECLEHPYFEGLPMRERDRAAAAASAIHQPVRLAVKKKGVRKITHNDDDESDSFFTKHIIKSTIMRLCTYISQLNSNCFYYVLNC
jgi:hypothetical protein